ncbi:trypsin-like serine protease [Patulibacter sp. SYSU D01012]|uniref:S1 family peptidase n=1 Tax=Patulibacter sp. SYSU D01012 TaxID=2817381 RepID=UPI001B302873
MAAPRPLGVAAAALLAAVALPAPARAVVGGTDVPREDYPAVVTLGRACTATLVAPDRLLTAGHCASHVDPGRTRVRIGDAATPYVATRVARHPRFRYLLPTIPAEPYRDVALVGLDRPVPDVAPLGVSRRALRAGATGVLVGYGTADPRRPDRFGRLRRADVVVRDDATCRAELERAGEEQGAQYRRRVMLCTQDPDGHQPYASGCNGDSGAPLLVRTRAGRTLVAGVDSWGVACGADAGDPEVFARTSAEAAFILAPDPGWTTERLREPWDAGPV